MVDPTHPSQQLLREYSLGLLAEGDIENVSSHIDICSPCQETLIALELNGDTFLEALRVEPGDLIQIEPVSDIALRSGGDTAATECSAPPPQFGPYLLQEKVGAGGMGEVYRALHTKLGRTVALKLLPLKGRISAECLARFEREMRAVGGLQHPNIVHALDAGEHDGQPFLSMELIEGIDLAALVHHEGVLSIPDACDAIRQAALGLAYAHAQGLVHRDVKPSNLMVTDEGVVKVLDLGLASVGEVEKISSVNELTIPFDMQALGSAAPDQLTREGQILGTPDYMSPEQRVGAKLDGRSDVYSLGATLYFLLTGAAPFSGRAYSTIGKKLDAIVRLDAPSIRQRRPDLPLRLSESIDRMLCREVGSRTPSADKVAQDLAPFANSADLRRYAENTTRPVAGRVAAATSGAAPPRWGRWLALAGAGAAAVAAMILTLRTPDGSLRIEAPDDANLEVVVSRDGKSLTASDASGWTLSLHEGEWRVDLSDPMGEFDVSQNTVLIEGGKERVVKVARRVTEEAAGEAQTAKAEDSFALPSKPPTVDAVAPKAFETPHPESAEWNLRADLFTKAYRGNEHGGATLEALSWRVQDQYVGSDGNTTFVDDRICLVIVDDDKGFWPVIVMMTIDGAEDLRNALHVATSDDDDGRDPPQGVTTGIFTQRYKIEAHGRVALPQRVAWQGKTDYRYVGDNDMQGVDPRPTIILLDAQEGFWPLILRMPLDDARRLRGELAKAIRRKEAEMKQLVLINIDWGKAIQTNDTGEIEFVSKRSALHDRFTLEWIDAQRLHARIRASSGAYLQMASEVTAADIQTADAEPFSFEWLDMERSRARLRDTSGAYLRVEDGKLVKGKKAAGDATTFRFTQAIGK